MPTASTAGKAAPSTSPSQNVSNQVVAAESGNELFFAVVGHVGSGTSMVAQLLTEELGEAGYQVDILKARNVIVEAAAAAGDTLPPAPPTPALSYAQQLQDAGDQMRQQSGDHAAVARALIGKIRAKRAERQGSTPGPGPVVPDGTKRAYILDSIRHPAEVRLLRQVYHTAFTLIGVVCDEHVREERLHAKYSDGGQENARKFMRRDERASEKYGQRVGDAFHLSDAFLDNTAPRLVPGGGANPIFDLGDQLSRLVGIVSHVRVLRPTIAETGMYAASGAQQRSACLSRQVGAALLDRSGNLLATGTNEVPRAGGGVYGQDFAGESPATDSRCAFRELPGGAAKYCSNTREQNAIIQELIASMRELYPAGVIDSKVQDVQLVLRASRVGSLLEFSRAVHAEMDALLAACRIGASTVGSRLFVTTFPCHYCARHIVAAGVSEVQFVEPYPKSQALKLHSDSITIEREEWRPPEGGDGKVLFRPFTGIAPRMYARAFVKDRDLKDETTGDMSVGGAEWGGPWDITKKSYAEMEAILCGEST